MNYLRYSTGNNNIILTAPHGGNLKPTDIPRRKYGRMVRDTYTNYITDKMINYFSQKPFYIISDIHRSRVDLNRGIVEGAQNNKDAVSIWTKWDMLLNAYCNGAKRQFNNALYIDIHSHNDSDEFHLGYNLSKQEYITLKNTGKLDNTIFTYDMLFGKDSIKVSLENLGYKVFEPKPEEVYYDGGENTERVGKKGIIAIQIEIPVSVAKKSKINVAKSLVKAIENFNERFVK